MRRDFRRARHLWLYRRVSFSFPESWSGLNVALCHDWLTGMRGGERCLELLARGFPRAPIYTLIHNRAKVSAAINEHAIHTSFLQHVPGVFAHYRWLLPLFPAAIRGFARPACDLLISTSHCVAKALPHRSETRHLCYCFTPMRYAWTFHDEYLGERSLKRTLAAPFLARLRGFDRRNSAGVTRFVAISHHVRQRIEKFYEREADVVYPPVDTDFYTPAEAAPGGYDLIVSALVPYKKVDLAVRAYARTGFPLKVVGTGTEFDRLRTIAPANVEFLGWKSDEDVRGFYRGCRFLVFPGEEDFGIVPLEAQACGKPVIAFRRGGLTETIVDNATGVFFDEQDDATLADAVRRAESMTWDAAAIRANAERFSVQQFIDGLDAAIARCRGAA